LLYSDVEQMLTTVQPRPCWFTPIRAIIAALWKPRPAITFRR
jgi:hypothetical protein